MKYFFLILLICAVLLNSCGFNCQSYLDNDIKPITINGIVVGKQKAETGCFGNIILSNKNKIDTLSNLCYCVMSEKQELWKYIEAGDSLYKAQKSLIVEVYRKDTVKKFDYPCCSQ